ncbi:hypothetical protein QQ045_004500 [Rhodiola kirilowii]
MNAETRHKSCDLDDKIDQDFTLQVVVEDGCSTPTREECRIPAIPQVCPPPPARKKPSAFMRKCQKDKFAGKGGYFHPPDLEVEAFFNMMSPRRSFYA